MQSSTTCFICIRLSRPSGELWRPCGRYERGGVSYRQLRSLRSLASGYDCVALRAMIRACQHHAGRGARRPPATLTVFACKRLRLCRPTGILPDAALDVVSIAAGIDLRKTNKEDNNMKKKMSTFEKVFREEGKAEGEVIGEARGRAEGRDKTVLEFIQGKRDYHVPDIQIQEELLKFFKLDEATARRYMEAGLAKA